MNKQTLEQVAAALFLVWIVLLLPWLILAPMSGMAFDGGSMLEAYLFVGFMWSYPLSVVVVWLFRNKEPRVAFLPFVNIAGVLLSGLFS